jgi:signal transduction histidine kinase
MPTVDSLHDFLRDHGNTVVERWRYRLRERLGADDLSGAELADEMPKFVAELVAALEPATASALPEDSEVAPEHGRQRWRTGFDIDEVVREYGLLGDTILDAVNEAGATLTAREARILLTSLTTGAAEAVNAYVRRRDEEARQQGARHLSFVAHELRGPLSTAWTSLGIVRRTLEHAPTRAFDLLDRSLVRLRELIDHVLVAGRLEAGVAPQYARIALDGLLRAVELDATPQAEDQGLTLVTDVPAGLELDGDERLLQSAIDNLVRNAVKFSKRGGTVTMRGRAEDSTVVIEVEDACGGLPPDVGPDLFEPFVQRATDRSGLGLGLAIVKQAVDAHRGTVELRDRPGCGCTFTVRLPASRPDAAP